VAIASVLAPAGYAAYRALEAWRELRRLRRRLAGAVTEIGRRAALVERRVAAAGAGPERLARAQAGLDDALAEARALGSAFAEVRDAVGRLTGLVPSK
jgi:hypothetical protein